MSWFDDQGIIPLVNPAAPPVTAPDAPPPAAPPQQGQFAPTNQGFLDWATQQYGPDPTRGSGFVNAQAGGGLPNMLQQYSQATGNPANYLAGPSGDRVDFGQGTQDALTSGGQIWNAAGGGGPVGTQGVSYSSPWGGGGGGGGGGQLGTMAMPTAPGVTPLTAPAPFSYAPTTQGAFTAPGGVPTAPNLTYNPMAAPPAFAGDRQATPGALSYQNLPTPADYAHQNYAGLSPEALASDPSYQFRLQQGQEALENSAAAKGMLRGGNTAKGLIEYGQGAASQEYAAADARARATNAMNNAGQLGAYQTNAQTGLSYNQNANQNALNFGQANIQNAFAANEANYGRGSAEAQQNFANQFAVNQANNAGGFQAGQANFANSLAAQGQGYGQALGAYGANQAAQNQAYNQALGAYGQNAQTGLAYGTQNQQNALANYQAQVNAALGLGNLNLGYTQAANQYNLGQGNLGIQQGQLDLSRQGQGYNQDLSTFLTNYQVNTQDPWNRNLQLAQLGLPTRPD